MKIIIFLFKIYNMEFVLKHCYTNIHGMPSFCYVKSQVDGLRSKWTAKVDVPYYRDGQYWTGVYYSCAEKIQYKPLDHQQISESKISTFHQTIHFCLLPGIELSDPDGHWNIYWPWTHGPGRYGRFSPGRARGSDLLVELFPDCSIFW